MALRLTRLALVASFLALAAPAFATTVPITVHDGAVIWTPDTEIARVALEVTDPAGVTYRRSFESGETIRMDPATMGETALEDGFYPYQIDFVHATASGLEGVRQSGTFEVRGGRAVWSPVMDDVIQDDLIVVGSACVGTDCRNGESFGFDTIRLKENNVRIGFLDTSNSASFPGNDWEITINDASNGGSNYFAVTDVSAGRVPFRVEAGARAEALHVDATGRIGFGTALPVLGLHESAGDTPALRLEQNGTSGFQPYVWDLGSNESNFFIRDISGGGALPFRIQPGAPTSSIDVQSSGDVLLTQNLIVGFADAASATSGATVEVSGDVVVSGTVTEGSDQTRKSSIIPVRAESVLEGVAALPIASWEWTGSEGVRHIGPMAQDFYRAFGLGVDETHIATLDMAGVALASIQALHAQSQADAERIADLEAENASLTGRLDAMNARIARIEAALEVENE